MSRAPSKPTPAQGQFTWKPPEDDAGMLILVRDPGTDLIISEKRNHGAGERRNDQVRPLELDARHVPISEQAPYLQPEQHESRASECGEHVRRDAFGRSRTDLRAAPGRSKHVLETRARTQKNRSEG